VPAPCVYPLSTWDVSMTSAYWVPVRSVFYFAAMGLVMLSLIGCGGQGDVSGTVSFQGKPLVFGTVQFEASDGSLKQGNIKEDGTYAVSGIPIGPAKAAVNSPNPNGGDRQPLIREGQAPPPPRPEIPGWFPIPEEYQNLSKPQLSFPIKGGRNKIDIELK
jgi:hypothetical protein